MTMRKWRVVHNGRSVFISKSYDADVRFGHAECTRWLDKHLRLYRQHEATAKQDYKIEPVHVHDVVGQMAEGPITLEMITTEYEAALDDD